MKPWVQWKPSYGWALWVVPALCLAAGGAALGGALADVRIHGALTWRGAWQCVLGGIGVCVGGWQLRTTVWPLLQLAQAAQQRPPHDWTPFAVPKGSSAVIRPLVEAVNHQLAMGQAHQQEQQRFVADAAHQLRTPLAALQVQVEAWVIQAQANAEHSLCLSEAQLLQMRQSTRRTTQLASQLLALSRVESGLRQGAASERSDMQSMAEDLLLQHWDAAQRKHIDLGLEVQSCHVNGQHWLLREMWSNLLDNAIKYTPPGGWVTVRCGVLTAGSGKRQSWIEVEDNGPGLPVSERHKVIQRFYRVPGSASEGSGLGLAIASEIAQGHGALMQLQEGRGNKGLRVCVIFPEG